MADITVTLTDDDQTMILTALASVGAWMCVNDGRATGDPIAPIMEEITIATMRELGSDDSQHRALYDRLSILGGRSSFSEQHEKTKKLLGGGTDD